MDTRTIELAAGQTLALALRRGDTLQLAHGRLQAWAPATELAGTLHRRMQRWDEGQALLADDSGTWQAQALTAATLLLQRRAPAWRRWWPARPAPAGSRLARCATSSCSPPISSS